MASSLQIAHQSYLAAPCNDTLNALLEAVRRFTFTVQRRDSSLDIEDLAQQVTIAVWQGIATYTGDSNITTWVRSIVKNKVKDALRTKYANPELDSMELDEIDQITLHTDQRNASVVIPGEYTDADRAFMAKLASGRSQIELAAELKISHTALRSRLKRLKKKIMRQSDTNHPGFND
jgi:RNA polymerase sigma factor (sigma-70 family)